MDLLPKQRQTLKALKTFPDGAPSRDIAKRAGQTAGVAVWNLRELKRFGLIGYAGPPRSRLSRWCLVADLERVSKIVDQDRAQSKHAARAHRRKLHRIAQRLRGHVEGEVDDKPFRHILIDAKSVPPIRPTGPVWVFGL